MDSKIKHLELIQSVINRMASNSFLLKGWSVTLVAALIALSAKDADKTIVLIAYLPWIMFWTLDAYYLRQERLFRKIYERVIELEEEEINFSLDTKPFKQEVDSWFKTGFSVTLSIFHLILFVAILIVTVILFFSPAISSWVAPAPS